MWNILHGGGRRRAAIREALLAHGPDVVALGEYRETARGDLLEPLAECLPHTAVALAPPRRNGLALLSRVPFTPRDPPADALAAGRWIEADLAGITLAFVYVPPAISVGEDAKRAFWDLVLERARGWRDRDVLIVGDLNTGRPSVDEPRHSLLCTDRFVALLDDLGFVDLWRLHNGQTTKEWSWRFPRRRWVGYRLDHAIGSPGVASRVTACRLSHAERDAGLSDHSLLLVDVEI